MEINTNTTKADRPDWLLIISDTNVLCMDGRRLVMIVMYSKAVAAHCVQELLISCLLMKENKCG